MHSFKRFLILPLLACASLSADVLDDIKPGEWFEAPASKLKAVTPNPEPVGNTGVSSVMEAWSGGSYDTKRDRLVIWGGGHGDYSGNEVYVFDIKTLKWLRVSNPSTNVGGDEKSGEYPDGSPRSRHTYNYVQYVPSIDRFCTFGGSAMYPTGATGTSKTHCFDFETGKWAYLSQAGADGIGTISARDENGIVWVQGGGNNGALASWDAAKNVWTRQSTYVKGWFDYYYTGAAGQGRFLALGQNKLIQWNLKSPKSDATELTTTGDNQIQSAGNPGFAFDSKTGWFVAWAGGSSVYVLEPNTKKWQKAPLAATNKVTPTTAQKTGTYGRFQYIPSKDIFIGVNRIDDDVFFFRLPAKMDFPAVSTRPAPPLNGKVELNILDGASSRRFSQEIFLGDAGFGRGNLSCRIFSAQSEILYDQALEFGDSAPINLQLSAPAGGHTAGPSAGNYFLQILRKDRVVLAKRLAIFR